MPEEEELLIPKDEYLSAGVHIGMIYKTKDMEKFIYKVRSDGLAVMNIGLLDQRIQMAAKFLASFKNVLIACRKANGRKGAKLFADTIGARSAIGRFMPGSLTNPSFKNFFEPDVVFVTDPMSDVQVMKEAVSMRIPIVALCDTFNETRDVDLVIPVNNKGKRSLALIFWLLTREVLKAQGKLKTRSSFKLKIEDFEEEVEEKEFIPKFTPPRISRRGQKKGKKK